MNKKVDLDKILTENFNGKYWDIPLEPCRRAMLEFGRQLLELAYENAWIEIDTCMGQKTGDLWVNKESILDTIKQIE